MLLSLAASAGAETLAGDGSATPVAPVSTLKSVGELSIDCVDRELIDPLVDPWRLQDFALKRCNLDQSCLAHLRAEVARISHLPEDRFSGYGAVGLWGEMIRYSGFYRERPIALSDLVLTEDPVRVFNDLKSAEISKRRLYANEKASVVCAAAALFIGPGKLKAAGLFKSTAKLAPEIQISARLQKALSHHRFPTQVAEKFKRWESDVQAAGLDLVRKIPGFHDEPLHGAAALRSVRLNDGYRMFYHIKGEPGATKIQIIDINNHDYRRIQDLKFE